MRVGKISIQYFRIPEIDQELYSWHFDINLHTAKGAPPDKALCLYNRHDKGFSINSYWGKLLIAENIRPYARGGKTIVTITDDNGEKICEGIAVCSMRDNFSYKLGAEIAFGRAIDAYGKVSQTDRETN